MRKRLFYCMILIAAAMPLAAETKTEVKIKETTLSLSPKLQLALPNGVVDVSLRHSLYDTTVDYRSRYDFIDNFSSSELDMTYRFSALSFGLAFFDKVDFEEIFANNNSLQRNRYIMPHFGYKVCSNTELRTATRFQNTYTASIDNMLVLDNGKNITQSVGVHYSNFQGENEFAIGDMISVEVSKSFDQFGGNYDYTQADAELLDISRPFDDHYIETRLKVGYPLATLRKPLTEIYAMGGYDMLRGYAYKEFRGESMAYGQLKYRKPFVLKKEALNVSLDIISWEMNFEVGKIGDKDIFNSISGIKASAGAGFGCVLTIFKAVSVTFSMSLNQPLELRAPHPYFTFTAV